LSRIACEKVDQQHDLRALQHDLDTIRLLRASGIDNALHLQNRTAVPGVASHDMVSLTRWVQMCEMEAQSEYRRLGGSPQAMTAEMSRLQDEIAEFERHVSQLNREKPRSRSLRLGRTAAACSVSRTR
jgi:hypothetical protein